MSPLPALSPRITLIIGVVGTVLTAWAGYQLGQPPTHDEPPFPVPHQTAHSPGAFPAAQPPPPSAQRSSFSQPAAPLTSSASSDRQDGEPVSPVQTDSHALAATFHAPPLPDRPRHPTSITPKWPLVLKTVDYQTPGLPPLLQATVQQLQDQFVKEVGGLNQNPADPGYGQRWLTAAQHADDLLRSQIGWEAFNAYSLATAGHNPVPQ